MIRRYLKATGISLLAVVTACAFSSLPLRAETIATGATGPTQATGPSSVAILTPTRNRTPENLPKVRLDASDMAPNEFVSKLLAAMTLEEKIGQMCQIFPGGDSIAENDANAILNGQVGSIFYAGSKEQVREAQKIAVEQSRLGIPIIVARDVIHGFRTIFPIPIGQATSWNPELVMEAAEVAASESRSEGIHWTFAPMVDITRDPRWGRIAESCGEDPVLAQKLGVAMVRGFQSLDSEGNLNGIAACPKHFVGYGLAEGGRDYNRAMVSRSEMRNVFLPPFKGCIDAGAVSLMSAFNTVNGVPATGHERLLRQVLKDQWGFSGFVVSDWGSVTEMVAHGYAANEKQSAHYAIRAGVDMEMVSTSYRDNIHELLESNAIQMEMIDEAVRRILHAKLKLNLFTEPYADETQPALVSEGHLEVARRMAQQSMVLLKNEGVLPLKKDTLQNVAIIGPFANAAQDQLGCWVQDAKPEDSVTPLMALLGALGENTNITSVPCKQTKYGEAEQDIDKAVAAAKSADVVLLFVGEEEALSGEAHSRTDLSLPGSQTQLVKALSDLDVPVVMVVLAGRPLTIGEEAASVDALLYAWHPGTMGGPAIADLLLGVASPSGKLPVTFPKNVGQVPLYYNHPNTGRPSDKDFVTPDLRNVSTWEPNKRYQSHYVDSDPYPLFHFGYGLTYTKFEYGEVKLSSGTLEEGQTLKVRTKVSNVGSRAGTETVQLYLRDSFASLVRPVKELKDFRRVTIQPGETIEVEFSVPYESLGFFNEQERYLIEPGDFQVAVGGSSEAEFSTTFQLQ